ncbi:MAG TPA: VOC family protein [Longimicrobium sp.]|nr:VOC family protein [Longimicrobium sp.]
MRINPYLIFKGQCGDAFRFYHQLLGGELGVMTHGESPMKDQTPPEMADAVMHAMLKVDGFELMGSDAPLGQFEKPQGFAVTLQVDTAGDAERIFTALAEGGSVQMPLHETFWSPAFGILTDRFGTPWMVSAAPAAQPAGAREAVAAA